MIVFISYLNGKQKGCQGDVGVWREDIVEKMCYLVVCERKIVKLLNWETPIVVHFCFHSGEGLPTIYCISTTDIHNI